MMGASARSRILVLAVGIALVAAMLAAAALVLARGEREASVGVNIERGAAPVERGSRGSELRPASTTPEPVAVGRSIEGRVVVAGDIPIPPDERAFVTAGARAAPAPVASDGTFRITLAPDARSPRVSLGVSADALALDARYLYVPAEHRADLNEAQEPLVLPAVVGARIAAHLNATPETAAAFHGATVVLRGRSRAMAKEKRELGERRVRIDDPLLRFEFGGLPPELVYELECRVDGWAVARRSGLVVEAGKTLSLGVPMSRGAHVSGRVVGPSGEPVANARVLLRQLATQSDASGSFAFDALDPGPAELTTLVAGHRRSVRDLGLLGEGDVRTEVELVVGGSPSIVGFVRWPDGAPAAEARVRVASWEVSERSSDYVSLEPPVDERGLFRVRGLRPGKYQIEARARPPGAASNAPEWIVRAITNLEGAHLGLTLQPGIGLVGRAIDDRGAPLARFTVAATPVGGEGTPCKRAGEHGVFELSGLRPGTWSVSASARGHERSRPVAVVLPRGGDDVELLCARSVAIEGHVVDGSGAPVDGAEVTSTWLDDPDWSRGSGPRSWYTRTNREGTFAYSDLAPGALRVEASGGGFAPAPSVVQVLEPGEELAGLVLVVQPAGAIEGTALDDEGKPLRGYVDVASVEVDRRCTVVVEEDGRFRADSLAPGRYCVSIPRSTGPQPSRALAFVTVVAGETAEVRLGDAVELHVDVSGVVRVNGRPAAGARVALESVSRSMKLSTRAVTDEDGRYSTWVYAPADVVLTVQVGASQLDRFLHVPVGSPLPFDVDLAAGSLFGTVRDARGAPVAGASVMVASDSLASTGRASATSDSYGAWSIDPLVAGAYQVAVEGGDTCPRVEVSAARATTVDLVVGDARAVAGRVVDERGHGVPDADVFARLPSGELVPHARARTDGAGGFSLDRLAAGRCVLIACAGTRVATATVDASSSDALALVLGGGTLLRARCVDSTGVPAPAVVRVVDTEGGDWTLDRAASRYAAYPRLGPLPPGSYVVRACDGEGRTAERTFTTTADRPELDVELVLE